MQVQKNRISQAKPNVINVQHQRIKEMRYDDNNEKNGINKMKSTVLKYNN